MNDKLEQRRIVQLSGNQIMQAANSLDLTNGIESPFQGIPIPNVARAMEPLDRNSAEILELVGQGSSLCFCNQRQTVEEISKRGREQAKKHGWPYDPIVAHHSSLDKSVREETEAALKSG